MRYQSFKGVHLQIQVPIRPHYFFDFPIIRPKIKVVINFIYGYQNLSGEKCKANEERISSIGLASLEKNPKNCPKTLFFRKVTFRVVFWIWALKVPFSGTWKWALLAFSGAQKWEEAMRFWKLFGILVHPRAHWPIWLYSYFFQKPNFHNIEDVWGAAPTYILLEWAHVYMTIERRLVRNWLLHLSLEMLHNPIST